MKKILLAFTLLASNALGQQLAAILEPEPVFVPRVAVPVTIPSGIIPNSCKTVPATSLLSCYLNHPSNNLMQYYIAGFYSPSLGWWKNWPAWAKNDLNIAYLNTVAWYNGGMQSYPGTLVQDPPVNLNEAAFAAGTNGETMIDQNTTAWQIYIGQTALTLAAEIHGWVPWSIHNYDSVGLETLFSHGFTGAGPNLPGVKPSQTAMPGNAITVFKFLKTNNLIGATRLETIDRVLTWSRWNLSHQYGAYSTANYYANWQYYGVAPVSRMISGTVSTDPMAMQWAPGLRHWTQGCYGTTAFLTRVFKATNIPVDFAKAGYHLTPYFVAEKLYLSHGDDPYDSLSRNLAFPIRDLLIDQATYTAWFPANDVTAADKNVSRRVVELNMLKPTVDLAQTHALDLAMGRTRATGNVFAIMGRFYTMAQLDASGFWTRLEAVSFDQ